MNVFPTILSMINSFFLFLTSLFPWGDPIAGNVFLHATYCSYNFDDTAENLYANYILFIPEKITYGQKDILENLPNSILRNELARIKVFFDGSWTIESLSSSDYTLSIDNLTDTSLLEAVKALSEGKKIYLSIAPDFPGYKIPLVWLDEDAGLAWFSTEMVMNNNIACTLLVSLSIDGIFTMYIKNPTTGELILQE